MRFDAQTQGWMLLVLILLMISLPVLISLHLKRRARGAKYAATLVSSGIRGEEDARALLSRLPGARAPVSEPHRPRGESQRMRFGGAVPPRGNGH